VSVVDAVRFLARAEIEIALLDRVRPLGLAREFKRLCDAWHSHREDVPVLSYAPHPDLSKLRRSLERIAEAHAGLISERARELQLEAQLAEHAGEQAFTRLACERYPAPRGEVAQASEATARRWIAEAVANSASQTVGGAGLPRNAHDVALANQDAQLRFRSDDRAAPESLWSVLSRRIGQMRMPVRLRVDRNLMSVAACGNDSIVIRSDTWLTACAALRIAEHELVGHLLPRHRARGRSDILHCGCASATDDEEGRALVIEERLQFMDSARRLELGTRHCACLFVRRGATFVDAVRCLRDWGVPLEMALRAVLRANRGGGMGREIVYLPAMRRVAQAFAADPLVEQWFEAGRSSLDYALAQRLAQREA
jgi:hypothetical protein